MDSTTAEKLAHDVIPFRDSHWKTRSVFTGLAFLLLWRSTSFLYLERLSQVPWWIFAVVTGLIPQVFLLLFPILTLRPNSRLYVPSLKRCLVEFGIAIPVVIVTVATLAIADYLLDRILPGKSFVPDAMTRMAESSQPAYVIAVLLFSFTFAPIAEEVFFRGFLQNAFRQRMPLTIAAISQSLIFGISHFFGALHAAVAFALGLLLTLIYQWRQTLVAPIFVHAGINVFAALGVAVMSVEYANSAALGVTCESNDSACVINQVMPNSAASRAGLREGDIVVSFDGEAIRDFTHLRNTVLLYQPGDEIPISVKRDGTLIQVNVVLQRRGG